MAEKHQVDKSIDELVDIRDVKLDSSLGQAERIQSFLQQIKIPIASEWEILLSMWPIQRVVHPNDCFADMLSLL